MPPLKRIVLFFLLGQVLATIESEQWKFLNDLIQKIQKEHAIQTLVVIKHHQNMNCSLQDWNPVKLPIIRINELANIVIRGTFYSKALALVCINDDSDIELLNNVALAFKNMRYERILLWTRKKPTKEFFEKISKELLVLEIADHAVISSHRLKLYSRFDYERIDDLLSTDEIYPRKIDFNGTIAFVKKPLESDLLYTAKYSPTSHFPIFRMEDFEVIEFAKKYNLKLKTVEGNELVPEKFDMELRLRFMRKADMAAHVGFVNPLSSTSLIVIVPCGHEMTLKEIFRQMEIRTWLLHILIVYAVLVLVENFILAVTCRRSCQSYHLGIWNVMVNLRAFRAILGMSFPISRRASLSHQQLFLAMSIFGMVFASFFNCKLSALLTKHSHQPQVTNLEELRESGLVVIVDEYIYSFIKSDVDADLFQRELPLIKPMGNVERLYMVFSFNTSYAYIVYKENCRYFNTFQKSMGRTAFCTSDDLVIVDNLPRTYVLQKDSIFRWPLTKYVMRIQEAGITGHWTQASHRVTTKLLNLTYTPLIKPKAIPLAIDHLRWLGYLLILGYGVAILAFIIEIFYYKRYQNISVTYL